MMQTSQQISPDVSLHSTSTINFAGTLSASSTPSYHTCHDVWIIDNGASDHMAIHLYMFQTTTMLQKPISIALPDGSIKTVNIVGTVVLNSQITLSNVFYVPEFNHNLPSICKLVEQ